MKKFTYLALSLSLGLSLSGCIATLSSPFLAPLGIFTAVSCATNLGIQPARTKGEKKLMKITFWSCVIGWALDEKNPGRISALNELPLDESFANSLAVTVPSIEIYNSELNQVIAVNGKIEAELSEIKRNVATGEAQLDQFAYQNGFQSGDELKSVFARNTLSRDTLAVFAHANGLSLTSAEIYLKSRFSIKIDQ